ncbi:hypothetical protein, partial [Thiolapillus sp.]|uniref:hypothetical protein n=1 Tax=Thiolapillus sp. TaxID=2017437 RepID=UPI003AF588B2
MLTLGTKSFRMASRQLLIFEDALGFIVSLVCANTLGFACNEHLAQAVAQPARSHPNIAPTHW